MKNKVIILSYYFPPCNLTAANRIGSWYKYLPENNIYPIVVTRNWTGNELTEAQRLESSGDQLRIEKENNREVHYLPYKSSWRDICFIKSQQNKLFSLLSKLLTFWHLILQNFTTYAIPYRNFYTYAQKILKENPDIELFIISGNPFEQFFFGYLLKKEFPNLNWIADYRDEWTTRHQYVQSNVKFGLKQLERYSEKKWVKDAMIVTVTEYCLKRLETFHEKKVYLVENGFDSDIVNEIRSQEVEQETNKIIYSGTIYENQNFDIFFKGLEHFNKNSENKLILLFLGSDIDILKNNQLYKRIKKKGWIQELPRQSYKEAIKIQYNAKALLMTPYQNMKGVPSSKLYDYIGLSKPVILSPTDNDIIERYLQQTKQVLICNSKEDVFLALKKITGEKNINVFSENHTFSRSFQAQKLASLLKTLQS